MPRIDPLQLLKCLSVLLGPHGGIKSPEDVERLVSLMRKFSKKLVSKCIYVQILQATVIDLLAQFMRQGGWDLVSNWIMEAVAQGNGALLEQLLALTLQSPLDVHQLQINACPRAVKGLTREAPNQRVQELAVVVVDAWVQMARTGIKPEPIMPQQQIYPNVVPTMMTIPMQQQDPPSTVNQEYLQQQPDLPQNFVQPMMPQMDIKPELPAPVSEPMQVDVPYEQQETVLVKTEQVVAEEPTQKVEVQSMEVQEEAPEQVKVEEPVPEEEVEEEEAGGSGGSAEENDRWDTPLGQLPVYKITIRDGKQVLAKVYSGDRPPKTNNASPSTVVISIAKDEPQTVSESVVTQNVTQTVTPKTTTVVKSGPRGAARRKQLLKPTVSENHETQADVPDGERKKPVNQEKISARMAKEQAARRAERIQREKHQKLKEKLLEREAKEKERKAKVQEEKDQETLARLLGNNKVASVGKIGKIPKKKSDDDKKPEERKSSELRRSSSEEEKKRDKVKNDIKNEAKKDKDDHKKGLSSVKTENSVVKTELKKELPKPSKPSVPSSSPSHSSSSSTSSGPKIKVKTFNAKPRATGLEEQLPPPPARGLAKKDKDKKLSLSLSKKRSSPPPSKEQLPPEKKTKPSSPEEETVKKPSVASPKLKPKPIHVIQESGFFMDALNAMPRPEPRKRKRRISSSKDDSPASGTKTSGKDSPAGQESPSQSPKETVKKRSVSPTMGARPNFYKDTLETVKTEAADEESENISPVARTPTPTGDGGVENENSKESSDEGLTKGVLVMHRSVNRIKKTVKFREEESLCTIIYFELDETERVNVTRTFGDLRIMELERERELYQNAKKMAFNDMQEERIPWRPLIPIDCPPPLVEPGKNSREKDVQLAREKSTLAALYFSSSLIPDNPAEPDPENHPTTDPTPIPLDDKTGNPDSVKDYSSVAWPEPKVGPPPAPAYVPPVVATFNTCQVPPPVIPGGGWRTGDGQVLAPGPGETYPPQSNFMPPHAGYETGNPAAYGFGYETPTGFMDNPNFVGVPPDMNNGPPMGPNNFNFPPPGPGNFRPPGPGNWGPPMGGPPMGGPPMGGPPGPGGPGPMGGHGPMGPNDMMGGPQRFRSGPRGGSRGSWQGPPRGGGGPRGKGWRGGGGGGGNRGVCKHFRTGYCRNGDSCNFLHPGVNGPNF